MVIPSPGILVEMTNQSPQHIDNIVLHYTGGHVAIKQMLPNDRQILHITVPSESDLSVDFSDGSGLHNQPLNIYFESSSVGCLAVSFKGDGKLRLTKQLLW